MKSKEWEKRCSVLFCKVLFCTVVRVLYCLRNVMWVPTGYIIYMYLKERYWSEAGREYWMIYRGSGFLAYIWFGSPSPHFCQQDVSPVCRWSGGGGGSGGGTKSYDGEKACPSINHSILSVGRQAARLWQRQVSWQKSRDILIDLAHRPRTRAPQGVKRVSWPRRASNAHVFEKIAFADLCVYVEEGACGCGCRCTKYTRVWRITDPFFSRPATSRSQRENNSPKTVQNSLRLKSCKGNLLPICPCFKTPVFNVVFLGGALCRPSESCHMYKVSKNWFIRPIYPYF